MPYTAHHHRPRPEHNASNPPRPRSGRYRRRQTVQNRLPLQNYPETDPTRLSMTVPFTLISGLDYAPIGHTWGPVLADRLPQPGASAARRNGARLLAKPGKKKDSRQEVAASKYAGPAV